MVLLCFVVGDVCCLSLLLSLVLLSWLLGFDVAAVCCIASCSAVLVGGGGGVCIFRVFCFLFVCEFGVANGFRVFGVLGFSVFFLFFVCDFGVADGFRVVGVVGLVGGAGVGGVSGAISTCATKTFASALSLETAMVDGSIAFAPDSSISISTAISTRPLSRISPAPVK